MRKCFIISLINSYLASLDNVINIVMTGFHTGVFFREGKESMIRSTLLLRSVGVCFPGKCLKFRPSEVASGGFCGPRSLVAKMLLHVEIHLV